MDERSTWTPAEVIDVSGPPAYVRTYLEQRDVRACLAFASRLRPIARAIDVGCGFGRLTPVLGEFAPSVTGFEREEGLVAIARSLLPGLEFVQVPTLATLPAGEATVDFAMTFTVLQHLADTVALEVVGELKRIVRPGGHALLVEETDPRLETSDQAHAASGYTRGRPQDLYRTWMRPWSLVVSFPRRIEPGYPRTNVGTFMLFSTP